jgi:surface polysaccharide O-acyltransferase-like enzyme
VATITEAVRTRFFAATEAQESLRVQALRGLACLLLIAFHVIGSKATSGMQVSDDSIYRYFAYMLVHVRMPLFAFLSGFVYAYRPVLRGAEAAFARRKFMRLWVPMITASTIYFFFMLAVPEAQGQMSLGSIWRIYFFPYVHFWFLHAMILIFAAVAVLERFSGLATPRRYGIVLVIALALNLNNPLKPDFFFGLQHALYLFPFFLLGLGANRYREAFLRPPVIWASTVVFIISMCLYAQDVLTSSAAIAGRGTLLATVISCTGVLTLLYWFPYGRALGRIGQYSFTVYLYHAFFAAAGRKAVQLAGITSLEVMFLTCMLAGLFGPIAVELIARRLPLARQFLLGQK